MNLLNKDNCILLIIDIQEKLVKAVKQENIVFIAEKLLSACNIMDVPTLVTEQYPKGLGNTLLKLNSDVEVFEKKSFSALSTNEIFDKIKSFKKKQIILCGIESHICVLQTCFELIDNDYEVFIIKNACASRNTEDFNIGMKLMEKKGASILTLEIALFELLKSSANPKFKDVQALIK